ncbi:patatin-like protein 3 isoform X1 [Dendrobium catenatum]|uniref:patatin-like protein 3 isoform X1 n=1 Tax=Dendrobium catenatum TaxID=906689 RepID=UPI00109F6989|nr:patatin-like protein 3 isoform X1 [Dendrobium catenatum]
MAGSPSLMEPSSDTDKLSYEIFTILESKFLFGYDDSKIFLPASAPETPAKTPSSLESSPGKIRILSIDASTDSLLAAASLVRLESSLRRLSGNPAARIADFFDIAAGSGTGGVLAALLFTRGPDGRPLFSADDALCFLLKTGAVCDSTGERKGLFRRIFRRSVGMTFRKVFGNATLRDTLKPLLIPCYDLTSGAPFLFSRADAVEADTYDFLIREVCTATCAGRVASEMRSVDGRACIAAVGGGVAMPNPAAAAITHVLHNKQEFPFAAGVDDLIVVSLGSGEQDIAGGCATPSTAEVVRIAGNGMADMVDQAIALAFRHHRINNYVRIQQANGVGLRSPKCSKAASREAKMMRIEEMLSQRNGETVLFQGRKVSKETNAEKLERLAGELIKEQDKRSRSSIPTVFIKQALTPRTSSATTATTTTTSTRRSLGSP